ncbi:hypothetical protein ACGFZC_16125 [[Kitasatospora] papulosa]|uniref:hypothetical protein n=1 Tax=[Kitasatospora] papulosa TaxID=1464011 RepID=UPI003712849E
MDQLMQGFKVRWTKDGKVRTSTVSYGKSSAEERRRELEGQGATGVEIVSVKPGEAL